MTNIKLPLLHDEFDSNDFDLKVYVDFGNIIGDTLSIKEKDSRYMVELGSVATYCIDSVKDVIICKAQNFESFFSTFFNIPFSVYCLCKNEILYHACSLKYDNEIFCLTGNKGVGKSTLTEILSSNDKIQIFSDDTIHINGAFFANRAHNLVKQTPKTVKALNIKTLNVQNIAGKYYSSFDTSPSAAKIGKIFHLIRTEKKEFELKLVKSNLKKDSIFRANIVGISHMPYPLITKSLKVKPKSDVEFYELFIPNDLNCMIENREKLKNIIMNCYKK